MKAVIMKFTVHVSVLVPALFVWDGNKAANRLVNYRFSGKAVHSKGHIEGVFACVKHLCVTVVIFHLGQDVLDIWLRKQDLQFENAITDQCEE